MKNPGENPPQILAEIHAEFHAKNPAEASERPEIERTFFLPRGSGNLRLRAGSGRRLLGKTESLLEFVAVEEPPSRSDKRSCRASLAGFCASRKPSLHVGQTPSGGIGSNLNRRGKMAGIYPALEGCPVADNAGREQVAIPE